MVETKQVGAFVDNEWREVDIPIYRLAVHSERANWIRGIGILAGLAMIFPFSDWFESWAYDYQAIAMLVNASLVFISIPYWGFFGYWLPEKAKSLMLKNDIKYHDKFKRWPPLG